MNTETFKRYKESLQFTEQTSAMELCTQAAQQFDIGYATAHALVSLTECKNTRKRVEAMASLSIRATAVELKEKVTESIISARVLTDESVLLAQQHELNAERKYLEFKALDEASRARGMLVASSAKFALQSIG